MNRRWSKEEVDFLLSNYTTMLSKDIAEKLGRTDVSVRSKLNHLGIVKKHYTEDEVAFMKAHRHDMSKKEIAARLGRTESAIKEKMKRAGIKSRRSAKIEFFDSLYPDVVRMVVEGKSNKEIADHFGFKEKVIVNYNYRHNIKRYKIK